ncbi:Rgd2p [Rhizophagus irregularis DAOM 197198w]|nr:Rgd2p [Rhizophagus irregularis DAOM 197198w]
MVLQPLLKSKEEHAKRLKSSRDELTDYMKMYERLIVDVEKARINYQNKCKIADEIANEASIQRSLEKEKEKMRNEFQLLVVVLGEQSFTEDEIMKFFLRMREEIPSHEVKFPILGVYNDVYTGEDIAKWLQENHLSARTLREAEMIGQELADQGFLRLIGAYGNKFTSSPSAYYQWKAKAFNLRTTEEATPLSKGWGGLVSTIASNQPNEKRARKEADEADEAYRHAVRRLDKTRLHLEESMIDHLNFMERKELDRIKASKAAFLNYAATFSGIISTTQMTSERLLIYHEALNPEKDIRFMIERYRTGPFIPQVILYRNQYNGSANDQTFGVPLEEKAKHDLKYIPQVVTKCLSCITKGFSKWSDADKRLVWTTDVPLASIHALRDNINDGKLINVLIEEYDLTIVAGVLKLYLLELPECLLTFELYEPVKLLYSINPDDQDVETRLSSVSNLITTIPEGNYRTLNAFISHLHQLALSVDSSDNFITTISQIYGFILLRPANKVSFYFDDKHPIRLLKDLIISYGSIFRNLNITSSSIGEIMRRSASRDSLQSNKSTRSTRSTLSNRSSRTRENVANIKINTSPSMINDQHIRDDQVKENENNENVTYINGSSPPNIATNINNMYTINDATKSDSMVNSPISPITRSNHNKEDSLSSNYGTGLGRRRGFRRSRGTGSPSGSISRTRRKNRESEIKNFNNDLESYDDGMSDSGSTESSSASPIISTRTYSFPNKSFVSVDDNTLEAVPITPERPYFNEESE